MLSSLHSATVTVYEIVDGSNLMSHCGKHPSYKTVSEAVPHLGGSDYLAAVKNGWIRQLTMEEEAELQSCKGLLRF
jgi:hypothetical protein